MAAKTLANVKLEVEGDLQVLYCTIASVTDGDTADISSYFKSVLGLQAIASTTAAVGATVSAGVVTFKISSGTPNLIARFAGN